MRKRILNFYCSAVFPVILLLFLRTSAFAQYGGGAGTPEDPYQIWTTEQMNQIGLNPDHWDDNFKLMADIDMGAIDGQDGRPAYNHIGYGNIYSMDPITWPFSGVFDGNHHSISNFTLIGYSINGAALFRYVDGNQAEIKNLNMITPDIQSTTSFYVGAFVGRLENGVLRNCNVQGGQISGIDYTGGLIGDNWGQIMECYTTCLVNGDDHVGGLAGRNEGIIAYSFATGAVTGGDLVGGLAGRCSGAFSTLGIIHDSYASGDVSGNYSGGLVGQLWSGSITHCYSTGNAQGGINGGLVGEIVLGGVVVPSYWDTESSGLLTSAGGTGKTTAQMQSSITYLLGGWDLIDESANGTDDIWYVDDGSDYPRLWWEPGGPLPCSDEPYAGGTGMEEDPYLIDSAAQLNHLGATPADWDKYFKLIADINLACSQYGFNFIGTTDQPFYGFFDGDGHTISNLTITASSNAGGLFAYVDDTAEITNLGLINPNVDTAASGIDGTGTLVGTSYWSSVRISDCWVENATVMGTDYVGGLIGKGAGNITRCFVSGTVQGDSDVGGLLGGSFSPVFWLESGADCDVTASSGPAGGLAGYLYTTNYLRFCYAAGTVTSTLDAAGGLIGYGRSSFIDYCYANNIEIIGGYSAGGLIGVNEGSIFNRCYAATTFAGTPGAVGGLAGRTLNPPINFKTKIRNCYWDAQLSAVSSMCGLTATQALGCDDQFGATTAQMQQAETFRQTGWDFVGSKEDGGSDLWAIPADDSYPVFWWQLPTLPALPIFSGGSGTPEDPWLISTPADLQCISQNPRLIEEHFQLTNNIDLTDIGISPIGGDIYPFRGTFDGQNHIISNYSNRPNSGDYVGLFGYTLGSGAAIRDIGMAAPVLQLAEGVSGAPLIGRLRRGTIVQDCWVRDGIVTGGQTAGGLIAEISTADTHVRRCFAICDISDAVIAGGFIGLNYFSDIRECFHKGHVIADIAGGFAGVNYGVIADCYTRGSVHSTELASGGFVGWNNDLSGNVQVQHCYVSGETTGVNLVGGLVGYHSGAAVLSESFWNDYPDDPNISCGFYDESAFGCDVSSRQSASDMKQSDLYLTAGWDFVGESTNGTDDIWDICEGTNYPRLAWEVPVAGDFGCPDGVGMLDLMALAEEWLLWELAYDGGSGSLDGTVNYVDWSNLQVAWGTAPPYNPAAVADFAQEWLQTGATRKDFAPAGGDGAFDLLDFAMISQNWLTN